jgi:hypothetical protein
MARGKRLWLPVCLVGLLSQSTSTAGECSPAPAPCPPKVVVEIPPPIVTFKQAGPTCVKAPCAGPCGTSMMCFPFSIQAQLPPAPYYPAPQVYATPAPVAMAPVSYAPASYAPASYAPAPVAMAPVAMAPAAPLQYAPAPAAAPMAPPPGFAPSSCGSPSSGLSGGAFGLGGSPGGAFGLGGLPSTELEAITAARRAYERASLEGQAADLRRAQGLLSSQAAAFGISLGGGDDKKPSTPSSGTTPAARSPGTTTGSDTTLEELKTLRTQIDGLRAALIHVIKSNDLKVPPLPSPE